METFELFSLAEDDRTEELIEFNMTIHAESAPIFRRYIQLDPAAGDPSFHSFIVHQDRIVSSTSLIPRDIQWHGSPIRAGEIGLVGTLKEFRRKGLSNQLMHHLIDSMKSDNIPLSFLWGIPNFYEKYHYYYAFPNTGTPYVSLPKSCTVDWTQTGEIRIAEADDFTRIRELYDSCNTGLTGSEIRRDEHWDWYRKLTTAAGQGRWLLTDEPDGGYALVAPPNPTSPKTDSDTPVKIWEIAATSERHLKDLVLGIFKLYPNLESLDCLHHPQMPVGRMLYHQGARITSTEDIWKGTWGGMVRLIDPYVLLSHMTEKLSNRLSQSKFFSHTETLPINSEVGGALIKISDGDVTVEPLENRSKLEIPASALTPMLTGYRSYNRFRSELTDIADSTSDLLEVLFPKDIVYYHALGFVNEHFSHE